MTQLMFLSGATARPRLELQEIEPTAGIALTSQAPGNKGITRGETQSG